MCVPVLALAGTPAARSTAKTPVASLPWLGPKWSVARETALQAREAKRVGPSFFTTPLHVPGSTRTYTLKLIDMGLADWFPGDHPRMPTIVAKGRGKALPCAACHFPSGNGFPYNAAITGLPASYIIEQVKAFRSGARWNKDMTPEARHVTDADLRKAAAYFSKLRLRAGKTHVVQTTRVPGFHADTWMFVPTRGAGTEPLGERVLEMPKNVTLAKRRDDHVSFIAYVPKGSIKLGHTLVTRGGGGILPCASCHGPHLRGTAIAPPLAGRWPTYLARQLIAFKMGLRTGGRNALMQHEVAQLSLRDVIAAVAYAGSLKP